MNHVMIGAALPLAVWAALWWARGRRASTAMLVVGPIVALASGFVAIIAPPTERATS